MYEDPSDDCIGQILGVSHSLVAHTISFGKVDKERSLLGDVLGQEDDRASDRVSDRASDCPRLLGQLGLGLMEISCCKSSALLYHWLRQNETIHL